jgi:2-oxo-4-hydroxy-4-carboxy-5-ureidoimidazoline decarboxylase
VTSTPTPGLTWFNGADEAAAREALHEVCAAPEWAAALLAGRPYPDTEALLAASDRAMAALRDSGLAAAIAGHPPIGRPRPGDPVSAREQRGMAGASEDLRAELLELNLRYQDVFGQVFLICATGLTGEQMRDALRARMGNTPEAEREIVRTELAKINRIRLVRLIRPTEEPRS